MVWKLDLQSHQGNNLKFHDSYKLDQLACWYLLPHVSIFQHFLAFAKHNES